jgi:hypothetical protein
MKGSVDDGMSLDGLFTERMIPLTFVAGINLLLTVFLSVAANATVG